MHLIVDIRSRHIEDIYTIRYATNWVQKWKERNPHDTCTFLIFDDQDAPENEAFFRVKPVSWLSPAKRLTSKRKNEIFRCVNFSRYAPYDPKIPTLTHIFDMGRWFYDNEVNANILRRKEREYEIKKLLNTSTHLIVPNFFTGNELVELWNVHESKIDIFPYLSLYPIEGDDAMLQTLRIEGSYFLYDGTYGIESHIESLLIEFSKYRSAGGRYTLVLHGNTGKHLKSLTETIRSLGLETAVFITGCLDTAAHESLYGHAKGWIYVGAYNTTKTGISLAKSKNIPLILSDISAFSTYSHAIKIHPNHLEELASIFQKLEDGTDFGLTPDCGVDENLIFAHYKNLLCENSSLFPS